MVLSGTHTEQEVALQVASAADVPVVIAAGDTPLLGALGALLRRSELAIANDSGVAHRSVGTRGALQARASRPPRATAWSTRDWSSWETGSRRPMGSKVEGSMSAVRTATTSEVQQLLAEGAQLVDVLPAENFVKEHLPGAISIPLAEINSAAEGLEPSRPVT